ncbi:uncharacterized protein J4E79_010968 [Alternaria viburni]|uniref:uncharacterized protein n=1 Tax=Alternaria viburni TaxID=566460 RepID=UPI0020C58C13|nr:uncharacterized protein J4E79_010968 [Alternaria viburni]KAI4644833.1 hypothetical protein J4E79_010968 [Alternaria viburni]
MPPRKRSAKSSAEAHSSKKQRDDRAQQRGAVREQAQREQGLRDQARLDQALLDETRRKESAAAEVTRQKALRENMQVSSSTTDLQKLMRRFSNSLNAVNSPLLRLPAELRNMIYDCVFSGDSFLFDQYWFPGRRPNGVALLCSGAYQSHTLGLLLASRQLHDETALHPYKLGVFDFWFDEDHYDEYDWPEKFLDHVQGD